MKRFALLASAILLLACAKKALPPNPDRFPPHLADLQVINQNRIDLIFDEAMQQKGLHAADFEIVGPQSDTLRILAVSGATDAATLTVLTARQAAEKYQLKGTAHDQAGNPTRFTRLFQGSSRPDTIAPVISGVVPRPFTTGMKRNVSLSFTFSKPMDTLTIRQVWVLPPSLAPRFKHEWAPGLNAIQFMLQDSLGPDTTVTFIMPPDLRDFAGNHLDGPGFTSLSADSMPLPRVIQGRLDASGSAARNGYIILVQDRPALATVTRGDGSFALRARAEPYAVIALADTNYDGRADFKAQRPSGPLPDTLVMTLQSDTAQTDIGSFFAQ